MWVTDRIPNSLQFFYLVYKSIETGRLSSKLGINIFRFVFNRQSVLWKQIINVTFENWALLVKIDRLGKVFFESATAASVANNYEEPIYLLRRICRNRRKKWLTSII